MNDPQGLELDDSPQFEAKWAVAKRVLTAVLLILVIAGLTGLFGRGPLSKASATGPAGHIGWERFARRQTAGQIVEDLAGQPAARSVDVVFDKALLDSLKISSTLPRAAAEFSLPKGTAYRFALSGAGGGKLVFNVEPSHMGRVTGQVLVDGAATPIHLLVWP